MDVPLYIFRAYDIRGLYKKDISPELFYHIGLATGTFLKTHLHGTHLTVGNDIRQSSPTLAYAFIAGVTSTGIHVTFTGTTSFGQTLFKGNELKHDLIAFITASHLPPEWNGIKFYYGDGVGLEEQHIQSIRDILVNNQPSLADWKNIGQITMVDAKKSYTQFFTQHFHFKKTIKVAVDCGGASMTLSAPEVVSAVGLHLVPVFCEPDPTFSKRPSDPKAKDITVLIETVKKHHCDFGVAFDGDGDRAVLVDNIGMVLSADVTGILLGKYGLKTKKGTIVANVECSKAVAEDLEPLGFHIKQIPVGHTYLTLEAKKEHAPLGIESSGHLILPEYFLFDDALVIPLKIAEILDHHTETLHDLVTTIPTYPLKKDIVTVDEQYKFTVMKQLVSDLKKEFPQANTMDGIKITFDDGWILIRPSNTSPQIRLTVEANTDTLVDDILERFKKKTNNAIQALKK